MKKTSNLVPREPSAEQEPLTPGSFFRGLRWQVTELATMCLIELSIPILISPARGFLRAHPSLSQILSDAVRTITPAAATAGKDLGKAGIALQPPFAKVRDDGFDQVRRVVSMPEFSSQLIAGMFPTGEIPQAGRLDGRAIMILRLAQKSSSSITGDPAAFLPADIPANALSRILASRVVAISGCSFRKFFTLSLP